MKNSKGFTLIEMIVGGAVLLVVLMIATSFFIFQSRHGGQLMRETGIRETVSSALTMIKRDIMQAGAGLNEQPELAMWVDDAFVGSGSNAWYRKLYVSYGGYLSGDVQPQPPSRNSDYVTNTNVYSVYGKKNELNGAIFGGLGTAVTQFTIAAMPGDIWGALLVDSSVIPSTRAVQPYKASTDDTPTANTYTPKYKFTISGSSTKTEETFTPVIEYRLVDRNTILSTLPSTALPMADQNFPELRRNGVPIAGGPGDKSMKFIEASNTDAGGFRIRCQFIDSGGNETWVPSNSAAFNSQTFTNLRMVEVQLRYRTKKSKAAEGAPSQTNKEEGWSQIVTKTINVSPRELVLARYN